MIRRVKHTTQIPKRARKSDGEVCSRCGVDKASGFTTDEIESVVHHYSQQTGWDQDSVLMLLMRYISLYGSMDSLDEFLNDVAKDEIGDDPVYSYKPNEG